MADQQRISYVPLDQMDEPMRAEMERCSREGTPRPESSAIRAHVPACFWFFETPEAMAASMADDDHWARH